MFLNLLTLGGPVVWVLLAFSLTALTITLAKLLQFWLCRPLPHATADLALHHLEAGEPCRALLLVHGQRNPRAQLVAATLALLDRGHLGLADLRNEATRQGRVAVQALGVWLRPLEVIAGLATLLGLFGTVVGMIQAFQAMEVAGNQVDPAVLSGGIWVALLTTAVGLAVAIPSSLIHSVFERRIEVQAAAMQDDLERIFTFVASHAVADNLHKPQKKSA